MAANWEVLMNKVKEIRGKSNGLLWDRTKLLVQVWSDGDFLAFHQGDLDKAEAFLDSELGDFGLTFFDVKAMFEMFPKRSEWECGNLRQLLAKAMAAAEQARRDRAGVEQSSKPRVTKKDLEAAVEEKEKIEARAKFLESDVTSLRSKVDELLRENRKLTVDLARAEGRISELERTLKLQGVAA